LLDVSVFRDDKVFDMVQYIDFYRYSEVSLDEMLKFLDRKLPWIRPSDTGRSTNCTINQVGIYEHRRTRGYSNYAFPYSWDVRMGHKTRDASIEEINEEIDENTVFGIMQDIGYPLEQQDPEDQQMVAYYTGRAPVAEQELREYLSQKLPEIMVPSQFYWLEAMPLTVNGKIDYYSLPKPGHDRTGLQAVYKAPESQIEQLLCQIWTAVMQIPEVGINDNFIHLGGNSLIAIRLISRINRTFHLNLPLNTIFESPTIAKFGALIERTIARLLQDKR
jgi:acyl carrier protein